MEDVNRLVMQGVPFRDAYKQVGMSIQSGNYEPDRRIEHSHAGSLGNLCLPQIRQKMKSVVDLFNFGGVESALDKLLK